MNESAIRKIVREELRKVKISGGNPMTKQDRQRLTNIETILGKLETSMQRLLGEPIPEQPADESSFVADLKKTAEIEGISFMDALIETGRVGRIAKGRHLK